MPPQKEKGHSTRNDTGLLGPFSPTHIHSFSWLPPSTPSTLAPPTSIANDTSILPATQTKKQQASSLMPFSSLPWLPIWKRVTLVVRRRASPSHPLATSSSLLPAMQPHHPSPEPLFPPLLSPLPALHSSTGPPLSLYVTYPLHPPERLPLNLGYNRAPSHGPRDQHEVSCLTPISLFSLSVSSLGVHCSDCWAPLHSPYPLLPTPYPSPPSAGRVSLTLHWPI